MIAASRRVWPVVVCLSALFCNDEARSRSDFVSESVHALWLIVVLVPGWGEAGKERSG